ncbi:hypothetical protein GWI33_001549 [Rhynchophorus ferrugineus]|uniref:Uncharacterized protein n=1 Tax=Rhynchophorus ferrugineus TaxID=354439 RepID=A0A834ISJ9_RHYFE|nr:hypothetical protein GWI33_001549 [Rhynchophorus ferrugineus]
MPIFHRCSDRFQNLRAQPAFAQTIPEARRVRTNVNNENISVYVSTTKNKDLHPSFPSPSAVNRPSSPPPTTRKPSKASFIKRPYFPGARHRGLPRVTTEPTIGGIPSSWQRPFLGPRDAAERPTGGWGARSDVQYGSDPQRESLKNGTDQRPIKADGSRSGTKLNQRRVPGILKLSVLEARVPAIKIRGP